MTVTIETDDQTREFEAKNDDFQTLKDLLEDQNVDYTVRENGTDGSQGDSPKPEVVDTQSQETQPEPTQANTPDLDQDPIEFLKQGNEELVTNIKGTTVIKKKGFRLLQHHFNISTWSEVIVGPEETDYEFCRVKAIAEKPDGTQAEAHASASLARGDDEGLLVSMADTRAKSRALSDVTGSGAIAMAETQGTELAE